MPNSQGSRSELRIIREATYGTTPSSAPATSVLKFNSHSLAPQREGFSDERVRSDRQRSGFRHGFRSASGSVETNIYHADHDDLLESAFYSTFTSSVLEPSTSEQPFTLEDWMDDISKGVRYTGCIVNSLNISASAGDSRPTQTFNIVAQDGASNSSEIDASPTAASSKEMFDNFTGSIGEGGASPSETIITGFELNLENGIQPDRVLFNNTATGQAYGRVMVSGNVTAYVPDLALLDKFLNETESLLSVQFQDPSSNTLTILVPAMKYSGGDIPHNTEQSRVLTLPFEAYYDSGEGTNIRFTKS